MKNAFILGSLLLVVMATTASAVTQDLKIVGKAEMRWLLFPLYQVSLKTADGRYQENGYPQSLDIIYRRNIAKQDLLAATDDQWQKLGVAATDRQQWLKQLGKIWPSIKKGDRFNFTVDARGENSFSYNGKSIGGINDVRFSRDFLAIWLSPKTSQPVLRQRLIGSTN